MPTRNLAIMFTDIKGFTARVSHGKRDDLKHLLSTHERLIAPVIQYFDGTIVKTIGDSFLARFDSPTEAVLCGVTIQEVLRQHNAFAGQEDRLDVRVAVNAGDVEIIEGDVLGEAVNLAARLEGIAEAGEVYFTEAVYLAMNRIEAPSSQIGERTFAGIPYPVRVFKVIREPGSDLARRITEGVRVTDQGPLLRGLHEHERRPRRRRWIWSMAAAAAAAVLVGAYFLRVPKPPREPEIPKAARPPEPVPKAKPGVAALEAGRKRLDQLLQAQGAAAALEWLRKALERSPELEPLRARIPTLDAAATADVIIHRDLNSQDMDSIVQELLARYPKDPAVPLTVARRIEGKVYPYYPVVLYRAAIERGANARDPHILDFCLGLFSHYWPGQVETAHNLIRDHLQKEGLAWAQRAVEREESGAVLDNAWFILRRMQDPRISDPYYRSVYQLVHGYNNEPEADQALSLFLGLSDKARRKQVLGVHRWVLKPLEEKGVNTSGYSHKDLAQLNLARLEAAW